MDLLLRVVGIWGVVDSLFLVAAPRRWARWWGRWIRVIGEGSATPRAVAALELVMSLSLILYGRSRGNQGGRRSPSMRVAMTRGDRALFGKPPSPLLRLLFLAPIWLYRLGLGPLLGHRFLLLIHRGRKSGRIYRTVVEVVRYDPRTRESIVGSGWGTRADWYRNLRANPPLEVQTGRDRYQPTFRELAPEENFPIIADYVRRLPQIARPLAYRLGLDVEGSEEERRAHAARLLLIGFRPRSNVV